MAFHFYVICEIVFVFYFEISLLIRNGKFCAKILFRQYWKTYQIIYLFQEFVCTNLWLESHLLLMKHLKKCLTIS